MRTNESQKKDASTKTAQGVKKPRTLSEFLHNQVGASPLVKAEIGELFINILDAFEIDELRLTLTDMMVESIYHTDCCAEAGDKAYIVTLITEAFHKTDALIKREVAA